MRTIFVFLCFLRTAGRSDAVLLGCVFQLSSYLSDGGGRGGGDSAEISVPLGHSFSFTLWHDSVSFVVSRLNDSHYDRMGPIADTVCDVKITPARRSVRQCIHLLYKVYDNLW